MCGKCLTTARGLGCAAVFGVLGGELLDGVVRPHAGRMIQANAKSGGIFAVGKCLPAPDTGGR